MLLTGKAITVTVMNYPLFLSKVAFLAAYAILLVAFRQHQRNGAPLSLELEVCLVFMSFYVLYGGISGQYFLWLFPFLLLVNRRAALLYAAISALALLAYYDGNAPAMLSRTPLPMLPRRVATLTWMAIIGLWWSAVTWWDYRLLVTNAVATTGDSALQRQLFLRDTRRVVDGAPEPALGDHG
jgi:hypothetical protein